MFWTNPFVAVCVGQERGRAAGWKAIMWALGCGLGMLCAGKSLAQEGAVTITSREIVERLAALEQGQKALEQKIDAVRGSLEQQIKDTRSGLEQQVKDTHLRIDDLRADMNQRLTEIRDSFSYLYMLLAAILALNGAMVGAVVWMAGQGRPIGKRHYERILAREDEIEKELQALKREVADLKAQRAQA